MPEAILIICDNIKSDSFSRTDLLAKGIVYNKSIRNNQKDIYKILKKRNLFNKLLLSKDDIKFAKYKLSNPSKEFIKAFVTDGNLRIGENDEKRLHCSLISFMCKFKDDIKFAKYKLSNPSKEFIKAFVTDGNLRIGENDEKRLHCSLISFMCKFNDENKNQHLVTNDNNKENKLGTATNTCSPELNISKAFL
ncbi:24399_t:CDS:2 [Entrophospora sp. SA101]|nr:24399_t:CDS:2 [Entrophospora sp. SA101]